MVRVSPATVLVLAAIAACSESAGAPTATVTDSAGVEIVTSTAPAWGKGEGWVIDSVPSLDIGGSDTDPHYDLLQVADVTKLSDGRVAVLNAGTFEVRYYDSAGTWLSSSGRKGRGPGEFEGPGGLFRLPSDTLLVYDYQLRRMSRLAPDGSFLSSISLAETNGGTMVFPFGRLKDGSWAATVANFFSGGSQAGLTRSPQVVLHIAPDLNQLTDTVVVLPGEEMWVESGGNGERRFISVRDMPLGLSSPHTVGDSLLYAGDAGQFVIGAYHPDGTLVRSIRYQGPRKLVTSDILERVKAEEMSGVADRDRADAEARWEKMPKAKELPAFGALAVDADGNLWVSEGRALPADPIVADVFDPSGKLLGAVAMPPGFAPSEIGRDYVLGVWKDDVGLEHVREYSIVGKAGGRDVN
jgi:hypothetical protein